jgi:4-diphosphocytidyl-2-C-methyl-D-erythritol kinase
MLSFPNCKINLGLYITGKREDGFHNLETVFYPVPVKDALEIVQTSEASIPVQFSNSGLIAETNTENNICVKAYQLLKKDFPQLPSVKMHLHKTIPIGAGLGGGSADASFTLKLLNNKFRLGITDSRLLQYALQLGSDCPFFIFNKPCIATGRGEILEAVDLDLSAYQLLVVNPGIHINTSQAFTQLDKFSAKNNLKKIVEQPIEIWKQHLENDFEKSMFKQHPEIEIVKVHIYNQGAIYASMSGSGSSVFGLFKKNQTFENPFPSHYSVVLLPL